MALSEGCSDKSDTVMIGWSHKVVTILLDHDCIGFVGTTLQQV
jgi:hypothetical protein